MVFSWGKRRGGRNDAEGNNDLEVIVPTHFRCPISLDLMKDPVTLSTGITYDRESIEKWIDMGNMKCPITNQVLRNFDQIPNHALRKMIQDWCVRNRSRGIERIPTPRIPLTTSQVSEICSKIGEATKSRDEIKLHDLLRKIKNLARESERNKKCIVENGVAYALSSAFEQFASISIETYSDLLKDILSGLTWMVPFDNQSLSNLGSTTSLHCITWFLKGEDLTVRQNSLMLLKELLHTNQSYANQLIEIEGVAESLFAIVKLPICPSATKAALMIIYYMISSKTNEKLIISKFIEKGLVDILLEILVDGDRSICEKALGVLDIICNYQQGKEDAFNNALTIPVLVKKVLRVSDAATKFSVSILWKLSGKQDRDHEKVVIEALEVGGFQKILVVLQVGCGQSTKEKATELLKLMNLYKDRVECIDSNSGFKYLKRSY